MTQTTTKRGLPRQRVASGASLEERILLHTDRSGDCWLWTATRGSNGYGKAYYDGKVRYAHRLSYIAFVGEIPDGYQIDHLCRTPACCNPFHLEAVTPSINTLRGLSTGAKARRRAACMHGHPYDEHGVMRYGRRVCRLCRDTYMRLYKRIPHSEAMRRKKAGIPVVDLAAYFAEQENAA